MENMRNESELQAISVLTSLNNFLCPDAKSF